MSLIKSISGIRGIIGGTPGSFLTPVDIVKFTSGYALWVKKQTYQAKPLICVGRDARVSGEMVRQIVCGTLSAMGCNVLDLGMVSTPTVEMAVPLAGAQGGIIITASHNPAQWNALKLLTSAGEFLNDEQGREMLSLSDNPDISYAPFNGLGSIRQDDSFTTKHINAVLSLPAVNRVAIEKAGLVIAVDAVNSVGGIAVPALLRQLGVKQIIEVNCRPDGLFSHPPEPLPENLGDLSAAVLQNNAHAGFAVDPDVDRLAIVCEDGAMFGEEYTLVTVADYILSQSPGNTVSNLSSTRALRDVTEKYGGIYTASAVGEVNVVEMMKKTHAIIGGEGNGGVIFPALHYGRDALVGIALFLSQIALEKVPVSQLRKKYPEYHISKNKIELNPLTDIGQVLTAVADVYRQYPINRTDGLRIDFPDEWVHLRRSNTEPIIRIYAESATPEKAANLAQKIIKQIKTVLSAEN